MKFAAKLLTLYGIVLCLFVLVASGAAEGRRRGRGQLRLRPLSAQEVYRVLREYGEEDAVPQGRVVSQGIAAITGFALGLTKGIGGALLVDIATSNATIQYLNSLNISALTSSMPTINMTGWADSIPTINVTALTNIMPKINMTGWADSIPTINMTALMTMLKHGSTTTTNSTQAQPSVQEICFTSRSLGDYNGRSATALSESDYDDDSEWTRGDLRAGFEVPTAITARATPTTLTTPTTPTTPTGTTTNTATSTTGNNGKVTCIVLQKRRRRRRSDSFH